MAVPNGYINIIAGPDAAANTRSLMYRASVFYGKFDTRVWIVSRDAAPPVGEYVSPPSGRPIKALTVGELSDVDLARYRYIYVNGGEMFSNIFVDAERLAASGKRVTVAGILANGEGKISDQMVRLMVGADEVEKVSGKCVHCTQLATFRRSAGQQLGGNVPSPTSGPPPGYESVCRRCYEKDKAAPTWPPGWSLLQLPPTSFPDDTGSLVEAAAASTQKPRVTCEQEEKSKGESAIFFVRMSDKAVLPVADDEAGWNLFVQEALELQPGAECVVGLGYGVRQVPKGTVCYLMGRDELSIRQIEPSSGVPLGCGPIVDGRQRYGLGWLELTLKVKNETNETIEIKRGQRICRLICIRTVETRGYLYDEGAIPEDESGLQSDANPLFDDTLG